MAESEALYSLANHLIAAGHVDVAATLCEDWISHSPNIWEVWHAMGKIAAACKDSSAIELFNHALSLAPPHQHGAIRYDLGLSLRNAGNNMDAALSLYNAAASEINANRLEEAASYLREAALLLPWDKQTLDLLDNTLTLLTKRHSSLANWCLEQAKLFSSTDGVG